jgi:hypothetical protein
VRDRRERQNRTGSEGCESVELLETRHVRNAFKIMPVKTDRKDAQGIAELMRLGWFRPVHCKSMEAQETRAMLTARKLVQAQDWQGCTDAIRSAHPRTCRGHPSLKVIASSGFMLWPFRRRRGARSGA